MCNFKNPIKKPKTEAEIKSDAERKSALTFWQQEQAPLWKDKEEVKEEPKPVKLTPYNCSI